MADSPDPSDLADPGPGSTGASLPDRPSLEHLKSQARALQRRVRAADPDALTAVRALDPGAPISTEARAAAFPLTAAQLVVARRYGFASWPKLRERVEAINAYARWPEPPGAASELAADAAADPNLLLRLACLNYTHDDAESIVAARRLLAAHPELAGATLHTAAATGDATAVQRLLDQHPAGSAERARAVNAAGGPFDWPPLLYLAYSRLGAGAGRSGLATVRLLLEAGADPNAGYLWQGLTSPFTALTGAFGGGEQAQSAHPDGLALAELLLSAGADPNDNQALYNRMFTPADDHLRLLLAHGLGTEVDSPWRRRLGDAYPTPAQMLGEQLRWAADHDLPERVRLLLDHGVDPDTRGYHPTYGSQTAYRLAVLAGHREIAALLAAAGAQVAAAGLDAVDAYAGACVAGDRAEVDRRLVGDPSLPEQVRARGLALLVRAAQARRLVALQLLLDLGADVDEADSDGRTALHQAAHDGDLDIARLLVEHGADPDRTEARFQATALGWAEHAGRTEVVDYLRGRTRPR